ncbi:MAG: hypothetical protein KDA79_11940 [Planctomycetaceae bacterium]|nr:hypothetical protein [Planctomycetaceae bacterium]
MATKNLWGDLKDLPLMRTPRGILQEQAEILSTATEGILRGRVDERQCQDNNGALSYDLDIVVPSLNSYTYTLLTIEHPIELFPVHVYSLSFKPTTCETEEEFEAAIENILSSSKVRQVLSSLLSQAS